MWQLEHKGYDVKDQLVMESLFMVGNGYLGLRGSFDEGYPEGKTINGTYINGVYDRVPMQHAEMAYGFPTQQDKQPRIMDFQDLKIECDGECIGLKVAYFETLSRILDYQKGEYIRSYDFETQKGKKGQLIFKRIASFNRPQLCYLSVEVIYNGDICVETYLNGDVQNYTEDNDPRIASGHAKMMKVTEVGIRDNRALMTLKTLHTNIEVASVIDYRVISNYTYTLNHSAQQDKVITILKGHQELRLEKWCLIADSLRHDNPLQWAIKESQEFDSLDYTRLVKSQETFLDLFWYENGIKIEGDTETQMAIRFMQLSLLQSVGIDDFSNVSAKGLSGEGYEGHYFWDTEIYVLPVMMISQPERAKHLLDYRYRILDQARHEAKLLGHQKGAKYAWRTISGIECSGYFPAGTAQYHINADIAYAFILYYQYTDDLAYMLDKGFEVLVETGRVFLEIGHYVSGDFHIDDVTGPDEYTAIVNNNYYTNAMVKYQFEWLVKLYDYLKRSQYFDCFKRLCEKLDLREEEIQEFASAADAMYLPFNEEHNMYEQDDSFLNKPVWLFSEKAYSQRPLLLHYHPLWIYRHQVLKQADTVLAHMLLEQYADEAQIKNAFDYYEPLTTHDSSLSKCIYGIMANRIGYEKRADEFFSESVYLDLKDTHHNTKDGLHMANIAGVLLGIYAGYGGLRVIENELYLRPRLPRHWKSYQFKVRFKGRVLDINVSKESSIKLLEGDPITINVNEDNIYLEHEVNIKTV